MNNLAEDWNRRWVAVSTVMYFQVPQNVWNRQWVAVSTVMYFQAPQNVWNFSSS